jgi:hypothetical protein
MAKTLAQKIADADMNSARYLGDANEASERGEKAKANKLYEKSQYWLDRLNKLLGNN